MSWGRKPYYIYSDGKEVFFWGKGVRASVPEDAIAQLIASMANRGNEEITEFIERGKALRPDAIASTLKVTVEGHGWTDKGLPNTDKRASNSFLKRLDYVRRRLWKLSSRSSRHQLKWDIWTAFTRPRAWFDL